MEKRLYRSIHVKAEEKVEKEKLRFLGKFMRMHELPCVSIIKPAYAGFCPETLETQKNLKH